MMNKFFSDTGGCIPIRGKTLLILSVFIGTPSAPWSLTVFKSYFSDIVPSMIDWYIPS